MKAQLYFANATTAARDSISRAVAFRDLGTFYFQPTPLRNFVAGRDNFNKSIDISKASTDDYSTYTTGLTFETWGISEAMTGFVTEGKDKIEIAREYYTRIKLPNPLGQWALESLEKKIAALGLA